MIIIFETCFLNIIEKSGQNNYLGGAIVTFNLI